MARLFDWSSIEDRAAVGYPAAVFLSERGIYLALDAVILALDRWRWEPMSDATWDTVESEVSDTLEALMTNQMIGSIVWRPSSPLTNELLCDGTQYLREDYPVLYSRLDAAFIDDADHFTTPDLVDRMPVGAGGSFSLSANGGEINHTLSEAEMPGHTHGYTVVVPNVDLESPGVPDAFAGGVGPVTSTGNAGGGNSHNNMPPYLGLTPCLIAA